MTLFLESSSVVRASGTVAERLRGARARRFVGREAELELFASALESAEPSFSVLFVEGPGGVGKTALLHALAEVAGDLGLDPVRIDLRALEPSPAGFAAALGAALGLTESESAVAVLTARRRVVLLLDTFELATGLEDWLREWFVPALPAGSVVVIAGRTAPSAAWRRDPGWLELLRVISLRNLLPGEVRGLLASVGVPDGSQERWLALTHGHPLALWLLIERCAQAGGAAELPSVLHAAPDVVRSLVEGFAAGVPGPRHRAALEVCARARFTTEDLLRAALDGGDAGELFAWLAERSFVEVGEYGLFPHDLVRDVIDAELRWRDPALSERLQRGIRRHVVARIRSARGREHERAVADLIYLHRGNPVTSAFWDWKSFGQVYADALRDEERAAVVAMVERHEGPESAALATHWLERQPRAFVALRGTGARPRGVVAQIALHAASATDLDRDPGARRMWAHAQAHGARPGDEVVACRFFVDDDAYQAPSPSFNVLTMTTTREWLGRARLAWYYIAYADAEAGGPLMAYIDYHRAPEADFEVGGRRYGVFARDWRRGGAEGWLDLMAERELGAAAEPARVAVEEPPLLALSQPEFGDAVRCALRDLQDRAVLSRNPLLRCRVVADRSGTPEGLADLIDEAIEAVARQPRGERLARALERTYVRPAATQEAAAELLGLPFSTYRGHLTRGIERVVAWLWQRELYGPAD
jgi:hypothetical protein